MSRKQKLERPYVPQICFVGTGTMEKIDHYRAAARSKGLPIHFLPLTSIIDAFYAAEEKSGSAKGNADEKFDAISHFIELFRTNKTFQKVLKEKWNDVLGEEAAFNPDAVSFIVEDSSIVFQENLWPAVRKKLTPYVKEDLLDLADDHGRRAGPSTETGPILGATGIYNIGRFLREAALETGHKGPIEIRDQAFCVLRALTTTSEEAPVREFEIEKTLVLSPNFHEDLADPKAGLESSMDMWALPQNPERPLRERWERHLPHTSVRAELVEQIYTFMAEGTEKKAPKLKNTFNAKAPSSLRTANFTPLVIDRTQIQAFSKNRQVRAKLTDPYTAMIDLDRFFARADAFVFAPLDNLSQREKRMAMYMLSSALVSKALDAPTMPKTIIVQDNGSWTNFLEYQAYMVNQGMSKGYCDWPIYGNMPVISSDVDYSRFCHTDIIRSDEIKSLKLAAAEILSQNMKHYAPYRSPHSMNTQFQAGGEFPARDMFGVATFTSAGSDNKISEDHAYYFNKFLAENGMAHVSGGGERHAMGTALQGYSEHDGVHATCISTPILVQAETKSGRMPPQSTFWALAPNIYKRMGMMFGTSDQVTIHPGGIGTAQEALGFLVAKDENPALMRGKKLAMHHPIIRPTSHPENDDHFGSRFLEIALGEELEGQDPLTNPKTLLDKAIATSTDMDKLFEITSENQEKHREKARVKPKRLPKQLLKGATLRADI